MTYYYCIGDRELGYYCVVEYLEPTPEQNNEYKKLRDEMIMERYYEKQKREIVSEPEIELVTLFDQKFGTSNILSMDDILTNL